MLRLSDDQLSIIRRLAEPLLYVDRAPFLQRVAELLHGREIGDGVVHRAARRKSSADRSRLKTARANTPERRAAMRTALELRPAYGSQKERWLTSLDH